VALGWPAPEYLNAVLAALSTEESKQMERDTMNQPTRIDQDAVTMVNQVIHAFTVTGFEISVQPVQGTYGPVGDYAALATRIRMIAEGVPVSGNDSPDAAFDTKTPQ
jgi:hypothetical protein